jgi:hypothetical protein
VIIEPGPVWSALGRWRQLLRRQVFRIFCAEALAVALGSLAALGLALPFLLALWTSPGDGRFVAALGFVGHILAAAACAPLLAYLAVANVFLYLYLAYGSETNEREK